MRTILVGTSNPSKIRFFEQFIEQEGVTLVTLKDLGVTESPEENGKTPVENAVLKAEYYGQFAPCVICADSGLYFDELPLDDPRQPGLHIRTPQGVRLDDEEMIDYYARLVHSLGGKVTAYYLDGFALRVGDQTHTFAATREECRLRAFTMTDTPCAYRRPGWPLDSLSYDHDGKAFLDPERKLDAQQEWGFKPRLKAFFKEHLAGQA